MYPLEALNKLFGTRSVIISRSTFPSSGRYAGHWLGDNISEWPDLYYSIPGILNFQLFGKAFVGADIRGFRGDTSSELCIRWMQVGSFYPFMRNHNNLGQKDQDPGVFDNVTQNAMRIAVNARYNILPYLYTLFYHSNVNRSAVARPLFFEFPSAKNYAIDKQFPWGDGLLISPVLTQVKVTFEKTLANECYCLRLLDPTRKIKPLYYHLDKTVFCGTDWGVMTLTKPYLFCLKSQQLYQYLTVYTGNTCSSDPNSTSCVLLRTSWDKPDQARWQRIINQRLGLTQMWSVQYADSKKGLERVLLCLTEQGLALNFKNFHSSKSFPKCIWNFNFSYFTTVTNYDDQTKTLSITCTRKSTGRADQRTYKVLTSKGQEIVSAMDKVCGRTLVIPNHNETDYLQPNSTTDAAAPPPCPNRQVLPLSKIPSHRRPLPLPPNGSRAKRSIHRSSSLRRSFSVGEKHIPNTKSKMKVMLRNKVSLSGGYGSDTEDTYQIPKTTHRTADRQTLYIHNRWFKQFQAEVGDTPSHCQDPPEPRSIIADEDNYWTTEISFTLQKILEKKVLNPDTLKLGRNQMIRLKFLFYPSGMLGCGWQEFGGLLGLTCQEIDMVEHFCFVHQYSPVDVLFHHWQFVHNKQTKQKRKDPNFELVCPPFTKEQLVRYLYDMERLDIITSCNFDLPPQESSN